MLMEQVLPLQFLLYFHTVLMLQIVESTTHEAASSISAQEFRIRYKRSIDGVPEHNVKRKNSTISGEAGVMV